MTCLDLVAAWDRHLRALNYSPTTIEKYTYPVVRFAAWRAIQGQADLHATTPDELDRFMQTLGNHGPAKAAYAQALRNLFSFATRRGVFAIDPTLGLRPRMAPPEPADSYTREELAALLGTAYERNPRYGWSLALCYYTGTRRSEVTGITAEDVVGDKVLVTGKGRKTRWIPLCDGARECLEQLGPWSNGTVLGARPQTFTMWVHRVAEAAGFPEGRRNAHLLRATFAAHLEEAGVPASVIRDLLGHSNLATTSRYLRRAGDVAKRDAVDLL